MTTSEFGLAEDKRAPQKPARRINVGRWVSALAFAALVGLFLSVMRTHLDPRVANPEVQGRPRPVEFLFGFDHWIPAIQIGTAIGIAILVVVFVIGWRRNPGSPVMLMSCAPR